MNSVLIVNFILLTVTALRFSKVLPDIKKTIQNNMSHLRDDVFKRKEAIEDIKKTFSFDNQAKKRMKRVEKVFGRISTITFPILLITESISGKTFIEQFSSYESLQVCPFVFLYFMLYVCDL